MMRGHCDRRPDPALGPTYLAKDWPPVFNLPRCGLSIRMPISGLIMAVYSVRNFVREVQYCVNPELAVE